MTPAPSAPATISVAVAARRPQAALAHRLAKVLAGRRDVSTGRRISAVQVLLEGPVTEADLDKETREALRRVEAMVVLAEPGATDSVWLEETLRTFRAHRPSGGLWILGDAAARDWPLARDLGAQGWAAARLPRSGGMVGLSRLRAATVDIAASLLQADPNRLHAQEARARVIQRAALGVGLAVCIAGLALLFV